MDECTPLDTGNPRSRHTMRIVPVDVVCYAGLDEIRKAMAPLILKYFPAPAAAAEGAAEGAARVDAEGKEIMPRSFAITFSARANNSVKRGPVIEAVAGLIQAPHKVDLSAPELTIMCEVMKVGPARHRSPPRSSHSELSFLHGPTLYHKELRGHIAPNARFVKMVD